MKIRYVEVINLPANHPKVLAFQKQIEEEEQHWAEVQAGDELADEQSRAYFNRFITDYRR